MTLDSGLQDAQSGQPAIYRIIQPGNVISHVTQHRYRYRSNTEHTVVGASSKSIVDPELQPPDHSLTIRPTVPSLLLLSLLLSGGSHVYVCRQIDSRIRHLDSGRGSELLSRSCWQVEWVNSNLESGKVLRITSWSPGCSLGGCSSGSLRTLR